MAAIFGFPDGTILRLADIAQIGPLVLLKHFYEWTQNPEWTEEVREEQLHRPWWWPFRVVRTVENKTVTRGGGRTGTCKLEWASYEFRVQDAQGRVLVVWPPPAVRHEPVSDQWNDRAWARATTVHGMISNAGPLEVQWAPERDAPVVDGAAARIPAGPWVVPEEGFEHCRRPAVEAVRDALLKAWSTI